MKNIIENHILPIAELFIPVSYYEANIEGGFYTDEGLYDDELDWSHKAQFQNAEISPVQNSLHHPPFNYLYSW